MGMVASMGFGRMVKLISAAYFRYNLIVRREGVK